MLVSCRPPSEGGTAQTSDTGLSIELTLMEDPKVGPANIQVLLTQDGQAVSGAEIEIIGDMTHAGMVPVISNAQETEPGLYTSEDFSFSMAGDWFLTAEVSLPDGRKLSEIKPLAVAREP